MPTSASGDTFQQRVWELIDQIPYGQTSTYGQLARELGSPTLARRVGNAVAHNPLSVVVPCHRVIGKDGKLTGYAGGLQRKRFLLELEGALARSLELRLRLDAIQALDGILRHGALDRVEVVESGCDLALGLVDLLAALGEPLACVEAAPGERRDDPEQAQ